jgi:hypothetical protein
VELNSILYENDIQMAQDIEWLKGQWVTANDANLLEVSFWAAIGGDADDITSITDFAWWGNKLIVIGVFTRIGGVNVNNIAIYDTDTGNWTAEIAETSFTYKDYFTVCVVGNKAYIGGFFSSVGIQNLAVIDLPTGTWSAPAEFRVDYEADGLFIGSCSSIVSDGTKLYITGHINIYGSDPTECSGSLAYDILGDTWVDLDDIPGSKLLLVGSKLYKTELYAGLQVWMYNGSTWAQCGADFDGIIRTLITDGTNVIVGGEFTGHISIWDEATWTAISIDPGGIVRGLAVYLTDIYAVGDFSTVGNHIAKFVSGEWYMLAEGLDANTNAIILKNNSVYVGGLFATAGTKRADKVAAYFTDFQALIDYVENSSSNFDMGAAIHNAPASAITDADEVPFWEDVANKLRKITWANIKATLFPSAGANRVLLTDATGLPTTDAAIYWDSAKSVIDLGGAGGVPTAGSSSATVLNALAKGDDTQVNIGMWTWGATSTTNPGIFGYRSRGTKAAPTALQSGDRIWNLAALGHDGVAWVGSVVRMLFKATENWTGAAHGAGIFLEGTPRGSITREQFAELDELGFNIPAGRNYLVNGVPVGGGGVSDGDKGDITVSGSGATWTIDAKAVTLAKMDDMATSSLIYRKTVGAGAPEVNTLAQLKTDLGLSTINLTTQQTDTYSPTGWLPAQIWSKAVVSVVSTTKLGILLSASANLSWYWRGVKIDLGTTTLTVNSTADKAEGIWYCYSTDGGVTWLLTQTAFYIFDMVSGAIRADLMAWEFYWDNTFNVALWIQPEYHAATWNRSVHGYAHEALGTRYSSGLDISYGLTAANNDTRVKITGGEVHDEDISHYITHSATPTAIGEQILGSAGTADANFGALPIYYRIGADASNIWRKVTASSYPFLPVSNNYIYYNRNNAGTWDYTTSIGTSSWVVYWIVATTNQSEPIVIIPGRLDNATLTAAQAEAFPAISTLFTEFKLLYRIIYKTSSSNSNNGKCLIVSVTDYRRDAISNNSGATSTPSAALVSFTPVSPTSSTNVQAAIEEVVTDVAATYSTLASMSAANAALLVGGSATTLHTHTPTTIGAIPNDGWIPVTWASPTRTSNTTFTVAVDVTTLIQKGTKLKFTDTTTKYARVSTATYGAGVTTITIYTNTDYIIVGNPSSIFYSQVANPVGDPEWFNFAFPTFSTTYIDNGTGGQQPTIAGHECRYRIDGRTCVVYMNVDGKKNGAGTLLFMFAKTALPGFYAQNMQVLGHVQLAGSTVSYMGGTCFYRAYDSNVYGVVWSSIPDNETLYAASLMFEYELG